MSKKARSISEIIIKILKSKGNQKEKKIVSDYLGSLDEYEEGINFLSNPDDAYSIKSNLEMLTTKRVNQPKEFQNAELRRFLNNSIKFYEKNKSKNLSIREQYDDETDDFLNLIKSKVGKVEPKKAAPKKPEPKKAEPKKDASKNEKVDEYLSNLARLQSMPKTSLVQIARLINQDIKKDIIKDVHRLKKDNLITQLMLRHDLLKKHINTNLNTPKDKKPKFKIDPKTGKIDAKQNQEINKKLKKQIEDIEKEIQKNIQFSAEFDKKNKSKKKK